eukprot:TRINITY_DN70466_c0_g1_i1.p1 TRINITY_DN70466_c0_g1~~TRINITY_DN70466_c0_g1_i1.p1  ORF type:complete len:332 (+),score=124.16 TRINITY_DN70466_c0_g1_i1:48-998(+)
MPPKAKVSENTLKEQVVQVVLPDGDVDVRLASVDYTSGQLVLRQLSFDDSGEVSIGGTANVKLASIGAAVADGACVKLHAGNKSGRVLLKLDFDGNETVAKAWADALSKASPPPSSKGADSGDARSMLKSLIQQQEEQVRLLETIIERKSEQVLQMQTHLEGALEKLQLGQELYAEQQKVVNSQQQKIQELQGRIQSSDKVATSAEAACAANAAEAAAGAAAAARARAAVSRQGKAVAKLPQVPPPSPEADDKVEEEADAEEERMLMAKLKALEEEKAQCEEQLRKEQSDIIAQTEALQQMMAALNLPADLLRGAA